jgi:mRNA interferase MazF
VVSADAFNRSRIKTVTVATITSNLRLSAAPGNVALAAGTAGLDRDCVVNVSQVVTLDKTTLETRLGILDSMHMQEVDAGCGWPSVCEARGTDSSGPLASRL